jgi:hypothetical protein
MDMKLSMRELLQNVDKLSAEERIAEVQKSAKNVHEEVKGAIRRRRRSYANQKG